MKGGDICRYGALVFGDIEGCDKEANSVVNMTFGAVFWEACACAPSDGREEGRREGVQYYGKGVRGG